MLDSHYSTSAERNWLTIDEKRWGDRPTHADGIALNKQNNRLYYHAMNGYTLYSIPTQVLSAGVEKAIEDSVKKEMKTPAPDGMIFDNKGNLYMGDLEHHKIISIRQNGEIKTISDGDEVGWADTFSIYQGYLYYTNSRIHEAKDKIANLEFTVYRLYLN